MRKIIHIPKLELEQNRLSISRGLIPNMRSIEAFGYNPDVDTGSIPEDITDVGGIYAPPKANRVHQIKSTSNQDKGVLIASGNTTSTGTTTIIDTTALFQTNTVNVGAAVIFDDTQDHSIVVSVDSETQLTIRTLHHGEVISIGESYRVVNSGGTGASITHIKLGNKDEDGNFYSEFIINNGTTNVPTTTPYYRIVEMHIHGAGSNKKNVGNITATADVDGTVTAKILAGNSRTEMAFFYVPKNHTLYLDSWQTTLFRTGAASDVMASMRMLTQLWGVDGEILEYSQGVWVASTPPVKWENPKPITESTDIWIRVDDVSDSNVKLRSGFSGTLVKNI